MAPEAKSRTASRRSTPLPLRWALVAAAAALLLGGSSSFYVTFCTAYSPLVDVTDAGRRGGRRAFLSSVAGVVPATAAILAGSPSSASAAATKDSLLADLRASKEKLAPIPDMLKDSQWDPVRTILKTPPVNQLWNLGESQNTLVKLAKETGDFELIELKDELAISLQMCDQYTYDNAFVYFQPGNGKTKLKEPTEMALRAMKQIQDAIDIVQ